MKLKNTISPVFPVPLLSKEYSLFRALFQAVLLTFDSVNNRKGPRIVNRGLSYYYQIISRFLAFRTVL